MHYANGRIARIGDVVRGKGYNVKYEIVGVLVAANPGATTCNCTIAHCGFNSGLMRQLYRKGGVLLDTTTGALQVSPEQEWGQLDAFVALDPMTGDVLPPEPEPDNSMEPKGA